MTAWTPGSSSARPMSRRRMQACGRVLRSSLPIEHPRQRAGRRRSGAGPVPWRRRPPWAAACRRPKLLDLDRRRPAAASRRCSRRPPSARPRARPPRGSSCSRCSGRGCRRAPASISSRVGSGFASRSALRRQRASPACSSRTGRRRARRRRPAAGGGRGPSRRPSTVVISRPSHLDGERQAREQRLAVDEHRAGAALAELAAVLRPGEAEVLAQDLEQRAVRRDRRRSCGSPFTRAR